MPSLLRFVLLAGLLGCDKGKVLHYAQPGDDTADSGPTDSATTDSGTSDSVDANDTGSADTVGAETAADTSPDTTTTADAACGDATCDGTESCWATPSRGAAALPLRWSRWAWASWWRPAS